MEKNEKIRNIDLRSEDVQELMGKIPPKILRIGISIILAILILLFVASNFIKYPSYDSIPVILNMEKHRGKVFMPAEGRFLYIIANSRNVMKKDTLAIAVNETDTMVLLSPVSGIAHLCDFWELGEYAKKGALLFVIYSGQEIELTGKCFISPQIKPKLELGTQVDCMAGEKRIKGCVRKISDVFNYQHGGYAVEIIFEGNTLVPPEINDTLFAKMKIADKTIFEMLFKKTKEFIPF